MLHLIKKLIRRIIFLISLNSYKIRKKDIKLVIGAADTRFKGWLSTDIDVLDITFEKDWSRYFKENQISNIVAEHVFEHLTEDDAKKAFQNIYKYLKSGGIFRFASPDLYHPSTYIRELVGVNGKEEGADDHKIGFNIDNLDEYIKELDFIVKPIEFFDEFGKFHSTSFDFSKGYIKRCSINKHGRFNDPVEYNEMIKSVKPELRKQFEKMTYPYTSLFIDFIKK